MHVLSGVFLYGIILRWDDASAVSTRSTTRGRVAQWSLITVVDAVTLEETGCDSVLKETLAWLAIRIMEERAVANFSR